MRVSVILPIYNGEKTLIATLDSLVEQTFQDFELIACIDGTRDGSESILERYSNKFKQLKMVFKQLKTVLMGYKKVFNDSRQANDSDSTSIFKYSGMPN